ncbi:hypothetical protein WG66_003846, partial [Moniliophthora roreri]
SPQLGLDDWILINNIDHATHPALYPKRLADIPRGIRMEYVKLSRDRLYYEDVALHPAWAEKYRVEAQIAGNERSSSWMYSPVTGGWVYMRHESLLSVEQSLSATFSNLLLDVTP